jgi:hypothetical protein
MMDIFEKKGISKKAVDSFIKDKELFELAENILESADMNTNTLKNFIRYLREIKLRDKTSYGEICAEISMDEILANKEITEKTKGEQIVNALYNVRYPQWSATQTEFTKLRNQFRALTGGEIIFPEFAEGNSYKISFTIKNNSDIKNIFETISKGKEIMEKSLEKIKE